MDRLQELDIEQNQLMEELIELNSVNVAPTEHLRVHKQLTAVLLEKQCILLIDIENLKRQIK